MVAESDDHCPAVAELSDRSAQVAEVDHPVVVAAQLLAESGVALELELEKLASMALRARIHR
ncbi:MAG: hypothetical protein RL218_344 [Actinomycetota bacterium]